jgi:hypothetical protein
MAALIRTFAASLLAVGLGGCPKSTPASDAGTLPDAAPAPNPASGEGCASEGQPCQLRSCCDPLVCQSLCTSVPRCASIGEPCDRVDCCEGFTCIESVCQL